MSAGSPATTLESSIGNASPEALLKRLHQLRLMLAATVLLISSSVERADSTT